MSGSSDAKREWVARVLGVRFPPAAQGARATGVAPDDLDLKGRLQSAGNALRALRDASAPQTENLVARYTQVLAAVKTDAVSAPASLDALEGDIARATSAARAGESAPPKGRGVAYSKLLLRWREAQGTLHSNLTALGTTLLARPDIQADPRIEEIKQAVPELPELVPQFGGRLEEVLDAAMSAVEPAELTRLAGEGIAAIDSYRQQLAAASQLLELEEFAATDLGATLPLHGALDEVLVELKQQLAA